MDKWVRYRPVTAVELLVLFSECGLIFLSRGCMTEFIGFQAFALSYKDKSYMTCIKPDFKCSTRDPTEIALPLDYGAVNLCDTSIL